MGHAPNVVVVLAGLLCGLVESLEGFPAREEGVGGDRGRRRGRRERGEEGNEG